MPISPVGPNFSNGGSNVSPQAEAAQIIQTIQNDLKELLRGDQGVSLSPADQEKVLQSIEKGLGKLQQLEKQYPGSFSSLQKQGTYNLLHMIREMTHQMGVITPGQIELALSLAQTLGTKQ